MATDESSVYQTALTVSTHPVDSVISVYSVYSVYSVHRSDGPTEPDGKDGTDEGCVYPRCPTKASLVWTRRVMSALTGTGTFASWPRRTRAPLSDSISLGLPAATSWSIEER